MLSRTTELAAEVSQLAAAKVACVGEIMLDQFIYGTVERISPEAPIPVLHVQRETAMLGGLGNTVRNLDALGAGGVLLSVVGVDQAGAQIGTLVKELQCFQAHLLLESVRTTSIKTRCIGGRQQILRVDRETTGEISAASAESLLRATREALQECMVLVLSDYGKGVLTQTLTRQLIDTARELGRMVIVDPKGSDYSRYRGASVITPNRNELAQASRMPVDSHEAVVRAARHLIEAYELGSVLATLSEQGMTLVNSAGEIHRLPAEAREVFDVSGAGDTVVATFAAAAAVGMPPVNGARLANAAAGIAVGKLGTAATSAHELQQVLRQRDVLRGEAKLAPVDEVIRTAERWRAQGLRIGFTNGCFDLLHPGHVQLLSRARAACDRLVVGLNSDASVKRLKGPQRPIQAESARATVLGSLASVDLLLIFDDDTPRRIIEQLRPEVLIKGADYTLATVVGADYVQSYGGQVLLVDVVPEQSTTQLVDKINSDLTFAA